MDFRLKVFEMRSYSPIPFILVMLVCAQPTAVSLATGLVLALAGELIRFWGVSIAGSETRTTGAVGATHLVTDGPFGYVRNPLYVGNMMLYTGVGIMSNALMPWLPLAALIFFIVQYSLIVSREEEHLQNAFGEEYTRYCSNVSRFMPRLTRYTGDHPFHRDPDFKRGIQSERRSLQALTLIVVTLLVLYFLKG
jgi:protein-S-isoprenylcysteine O-methyltransferase Ste14